MCLRVVYLFVGFSCLSSGRLATQKFLTNPGIQRDGWRGRSAARGRIALLDEDFDPAAGGIHVNRNGRGVAIPAADGTPGVASLADGSSGAFSAADGRQEIIPPPGDGGSDALPVPHGQRDATLVADASSGDGGAVPTDESTAEAAFLEGSGDDAPFPPACLHSPCGPDELVVSAGPGRTLTCRAPDAGARLGWFSRRGRALAGRREGRAGVVLEPPRDPPGPYVCLKRSGRGCCARELAVPEAPDYQGHLAVVGSVAAGALLLCVLVAALRRVKTKKCDVKLEMQAVPQTS